MTEKEILKHDKIDHVINGWGVLFIGIANLLPLYSDDYIILLKIWPIVFILLNVYFFIHIEPWIKDQYKTWAGTLKHKHTLDHRIMTGGGIAIGIIEMLLAFNIITNFYFTLLFPIGFIVFGILFMLHHWGEEPLADRQHRDIGFLAIAAGICLGLSILFISLDQLAYVWPILLICQSYLFLSYMSTLPHGAHGSSPMKNETHHA